MTKPAFIVEGHMEQLIVKSICPTAVVRRLELGGDDVSMKAIAARVALLFKLMNNKFFPVFVIFDRERREDNCNKLVSELELHIKDHGIDPGQFRFSICDRTIENWIIGDSNLMRDICNVVPDEFDGSFGKSKLKSLLGDSVIYRETTIGVDLFLRSNPKVIYNNSSSFKLFFDSIDIECWWKEP